MYAVLLYSQAIFISGLEENKKRTGRPLLIRRLYL